jgi:hypothetical protein
MRVPSVHGSVTKRWLCTPVERIYEYKTRGEEQWHWGPHGAIARGGRDRCAMLWRGRGQTGALAPWGVLVRSSVFSPSATR